MCETCPAHILGPGEVAGKVARSRGGRKVVVGFCYLMFPFAVWNELHWWTLAVMAAGGALAAAVHGVVRILHRRVVVPAATPAQRVAELERRRRNAIPGRTARPALPRNLAITKGRQALPAPAKVLPAAAHEFVPLDWAKGCGYLAHPHANRCLLPAKAHPAAAVPAPARRAAR